MILFILTERTSSVTDFHNFSNPSRHLKPIRLQPTFIIQENQQANKKTMRIQVDFSFFPNNLIPIITDSVELKQFLIEGNFITDDSVSDTNNSKTAIFEFHGSLKDFESLLRSILAKNSIEEYTITQDMERENTIAILRSGDLEQLKIFVCDFCSAVFHSEDEKYIHQRAHYFY
ncbi:protein of unknown function [Candidatus Nitrosocosmicus franklandus]|uniref:C2H2-type domain-containing protein n=1 Tax=Candidatus Nitrosocosmicus franklandianus TaxID=1798806 RepID=A0A484I856_9ARCH|nr:protein of unknown function [Candidatus Nitrosocosmicus franklandus]